MWEYFIPENMVEVPKRLVETRPEKESMRFQTVEKGGVLSSFGKSFFRTFESKVRQRVFRASAVQIFWNEYVGQCRFCSYYYLWPNLLDKPCEVLHRIVPLRALLFGSNPDSPSLSSPKFYRSRVPHWKASQCQEPRRDSWSTRGGLIDIPLRLHNERKSAAHGTNNNEVYRSLKDESSTNRSVRYRPTTFFFSIAMNLANLWS